MFAAWGCASKEGKQLLLESLLRVKQPTRSAHTAPWLWAGCKMDRQQIFSTFQSLGTGAPLRVTDRLWAEGTCGAGTGRKPAPAPGGGVPCVVYTGARKPSQSVRVGCGRRSPQVQAGPPTLCPLIHIGKFAKLHIFLNWVLHKFHSNLIPCNMEKSWNEWGRVKSWNQAVTGDNSLKIYGASLRLLAWPSDDEQTIAGDSESHKV